MIDLTLGELETKLFRKLHAGEPVHAHAFPDAHNNALESLKMRGYLNVHVFGLSRNILLTDLGRRQAQERWGKP